MEGDLGIGSDCVKWHVIELIELSFRMGDFRNEVSRERSRNSDGTHSSLATGVCDTHGSQLLKVILLNNDAEGHSLLPFSVNYLLSLWLIDWPSAESPAD